MNCTLHWYVGTSTKLLVLRSWCCNQENINTLAHANGSRLFISYTSVKSLISTSLVKPYVLVVLYQKVLVASSFTCAYMDGYYINTFYVLPDIL